MQANKGMKIYQRAILFFILEFILVKFAFYYSADSSWTFMNSRFPLIIYPTVAILLGLFLGLFFFLVIQHSKRIKSFYAIGLNISAGLFMIGICLSLLHSRNYNKRHGYNLQNHNMLSDLEEWHREFAATGFELLQSNFIYPRDLKLEKYFFQIKDTVIHNSKDTVRTLYFKYHFDNKPAVKFFSKISVYKNTPSMLIFNALTDTSSNYASALLQLKKDDAETIKEIKQINKLLPDSLQKILNKYIE
jgi:hypothetical protein